ncbi:hypothetical protein WOLCODRAFT_86186 [Wolfiporia cocos MD-104 SS10]|uniref:Uncharacterized protein n=1 Tax=Wolfiporia cocos (strain MD-104) TaxID=742152 RepID=A0A2H3JUY9_WOLCO|nr:hypothetical protein WOLCODRAFT_86186 [Wolfiporia cocos MD-104 SS10]
MQHLIRNARLEDDIKDPDILRRIRNPPQQPFDIDDPVKLLSVEIYLGLDDCSQKIYNHFRSALLRCPPHIELLTYAVVKSYVENLTGIFELRHDCCVNSCMAYTGIYSELDKCNYCGEPRYEERRRRRKRRLVPRKQSTTIPIAPVIQAMRRSTEGSRAAEYRATATRQVLAALQETNGELEKISDYIHGKNYLEAVVRGDIKDEDTCLMFSIDGAQLYASKVSDCWMFIWVLLDYAPDVRYRKTHIMPGGFIPGPSKPKNVDSFLLPSLRHAASLMGQREKLKIWSEQRGLFESKLYIVFGTADGPGMTYLNGTVGHSGAQGCRLYCPLKGRRKPGGSHYYPACQLPHNYSVPNCTHPDICLRDAILDSQEASDRYYANLERLLNASTQREYERIRLETGICKPSLFGGFPADCFLGIPGGFPADIMHLTGPNHHELFFDLWRGTIKCGQNDDKSTWVFAVLTGDTWTAHGDAVAKLVSYLPGSFDRPPRNPAEKINSGYKAQEQITHLYEYCIALLYNVLPPAFYRNFCQLVRGVRLMYQREILPKDITEAHEMLLTFSEDYEELYCDRHPDRIHFVRQSVHSVNHMPSETERIGPYTTYSQWVMERAIELISRQLRSHVHPYANLAERGLVRCRTNALRAMMPELNETKSLPRGAIELGGGYALLRAASKDLLAMTGTEAQSLSEYLEREGIEQTDYFRDNMRVRKWARALLPSKQVARSLWAEEGIPIQKLRMARNVKVRIDGDKIEIGEVQYFFTLKLNTTLTALAIISLYSEPDKDLLEYSYNTLYSCECLETPRLVVVKVTSIMSVVGMLPHPERNGPHGRDLEGRFFLVEKLGLEILQMAGIHEEVTEV